MNRSSFSARFIVPLSVVLIPFVASSLLYFHSWRIQDDLLHRWVAIVSGLVMILSLCLGAAVIHPLAFFRGARPAERTLACLVVPLIYSVYEIYTVSAIFPLAESLYYCANPSVLMIFLLAVGLAGASECACRGVSRLRGATVKVCTPLPLAAMGVMLLGAYFMLIWGNGVHLFYLYVEGYLALFSAA